MQHPLRRFKAELFKALSHPGRIKMLEALRAGEKTVGELQALLDDEPGSASQHLALLRAKHIVVGRKEGNNIFYSVRDPLLFRILDAAREIFSNELVDSQEMLSYVQEEEEAVGAGRSGAAEGP
jgi:DNA-binding transcriptional ArsR family regulator